jgi:hypothetical protein
MSVGQDRQVEVSTLGYYRTSIVVCHYVLWAYHDIVPRFDCLALGKTDCILLDDLFDHRLWDSAFVGNGSEEPPKSRSHITTAEMQLWMHGQPGGSERLVDVDAEQEICSNYITPVIA